MAKIKRLSKYISILGDNDEKLFEYKTYEQQFDEHQNCIKEIEFNASNEIESASGYKYNGNNKMIEEIHYFNEDEVGEIIKYKLSEDGKPLEIETVYADDAKSIKKISRAEHFLSVKSFDEAGEQEGEETIKFDQNGRPLEEVQIDEDGNVVQRSVYKYDESDRVTSRVNYGEKDEFLVKALFEYDDDGNLVKLLQLNEKGNLISSNNYSYDKQGNQVLLQSNQHVQRTAYDDGNRIVHQETMNRSNNMVENFTEYKYGDHGLVIEERKFEIGEAYQLQPNVYGRTGSNLSLTRYEYEFY